MPNLERPLGQGAVLWSCGHSGTQARCAGERAVECSDPNGMRGTAIAAVPQFIGARIDRGGMLLPSHPAAIADDFVQGDNGSRLVTLPGTGGIPFYLIEQWGAGGRGQFTW